MTLFARLLVLVAVALLPAIGVQLHFRHEAASAREAAAREEAGRLVHAVSTHLQSVTEGARQFLVALRDRRSVVEGASERCDAAFARMIRDLPQYVAISGTDARGIITCAADPRARGLDISDIAWFREARERGGFVTGEYAVGRASGQPSLHLGYAIEAPDGRFQGGLVVALGLDWLAGRIATGPLPRGAVLLVADRNGTILAGLPETGARGGRLPPELLDRMRSGGGLTLTEATGHDGILRIWGVSPLGTEPRHLFVAAGLDAAEWALPARAANRQGALLILAGAAIALGLALVVARRAIGGPVAALLGVAERWQGGELSARAAEAPALKGQSAGSEFRRLAEAFDAVAAAAASREAALRESEGRFRALAEAVPEMLVSMDPEGGWDYGSPRFADYTGLAQEEATGRGWMRALHPEDVAVLHDTALAAIRAGIPWEATCRLRRHDGAWRWFMLRAVPIRDAQGPVLRWFGAITDIDDRKRDEAALRESEARFRQIAEAVEDVIWLAEPAGGRTIYLSPAFRRVFGRDPPPLPGLSSAWDDAVHPADRARVAATWAGAATDGFDIEYRIVRPDGAVRWLRDRCFPVHGNGGVHRVAGVATDVTERRAARERQALLAAELDHRAKNILAVVQSLVRLTPAEDPAGYARAVEGRIAALARAHGLLAKGSWSGAALEEMLRAELAPHARAGRMATDGPPVTVVTEAVQPLSMVLHELATNAAKYGSLSRTDGRLSVTWRITAEGALRIEWMESGGPPARPPTRSGFGTTLIETNIRGPLHGAVAYEWLPGGLRVTMIIGATLLRACGGVQEAPGAVPAASPELLRGLAGRRVLLVEDEVLLALETSATLAALGCEVVGPAGTVAQALRLAKAAGARLDAAVLDANLGGEDVAPVAELLRMRGVKLVIVTGYAGLARQWANGAPVLEKPLARGALGAALGDVLGLQPAG